MATRNIYITDTTDPLEDGSIDHPYDTFADINWTTGGANSIFDWVAAGDDVFINLAKGDTWGTTFTVGTSGASGHPVTIQSYGTGADPIIDLNDADLHGVVIDTKDYITIDGIEIRDYSTASGHSGVRIVDGNYIIVQNCTIDGENDVVNNGGINIRGSSDNCTIDSNTISNAMYGIFCTYTTDNPQSLTIKNNTIFSIDEGTDAAADGIYFYNGGGESVRDYTGTVIEYNHIYDCTDNAIDIAYTANITIRYNNCHGNDLGTGDKILVKLSQGGAAEGASTGVECYYNLFWDSEDVVVYGGKFEGNFYNNVVYSSGGSLMWTGHNDTTATSQNIVNNIFVDPDTTGVCIDYESAATNTLDNNLYYQSAGTGHPLIQLDGDNYTTAQWAAYQAASTPLDANSPTPADPLFVSGGGFRIRFDSPCKDAGTDVSLTRDYAGRTVPRGAPDIGAYELSYGWFKKQYNKLRLML